jgi:gliding motility-associated-like protein
MRKILRGHVFIKNILFTFCLGLSFMGKTHAQVSGMFTINPGSPASGSNFQTFTAAVASLSGGVNGAVIFNVTAGTYNEQIILNNISGTSAVNTITFNCNGATLTFLSTNSNQRAGVKINNTDYVTFDNLTVVPLADDWNEYGYGFHLINDADHNTIKNCHVNNNVNWGDVYNNEGIVINGNHGYADGTGESHCDDNIILNNTISGVNTGITLSSESPSGTHTTMSGNRLEGNTISNCTTYGILMQYTDNTVITKNEITGGPDAIWGTCPIITNYYNNSFTITSNKIHAFYCDPGNSQAGMMINSEGEAGKESLIANNLIYDLQSDNIMYGIASLYPNNTYAATYLNIYNNTISLDDQTYTGYLTYGMFFENTTNINVFNNIVSVTRFANDKNYGIYFNVAPVSFNANNNVYYIAPGSALTVGIGALGSTNSYPEIDKWQKATGLEYYSLSVNPAFANLPGFDLRPTAQLIDNLGKPVTGITSDINGTARNAVNPDAGCFEFNSANCSSAVTAGATIVLPDSILCSGPKISFSLTGHTPGNTQTYIWETSSSATTGYTAVTSATAYPSYDVTPTTTKYYRAAVTCGGVTAYSTPVRVLVNTTLSAGTYTINNALPTGGINFNSFKDAIIALGCGLTGPVVFNVTSGSGPYNEQVIVPQINTTKTNTVTFNGNGATVTYKPITQDQSAVIKLDGADYITLDSLNVVVEDNPGDNYGFGIQMMADADNNTVKRCKVTVNNSSTDPAHIYYAGIVINPNADDPADNGNYSYCDSNKVINNTVNGGYFGISCASDNQSPINIESYGNVIKGNTVIDNAHSGIYVGGTAYTLIDSNDISQPTRNTVRSYAGIFIDNQNYGLTISRNKIHDVSIGSPNSTVQTEGIYVINCSGVSGENRMVNNMVYNYRGNGWQYGLYFQNVNNFKVYHNTISLEDTAAIGSYVSRGIGLINTSAAAVEFKNNNVTIRRGRSGLAYCMFLNFNVANSLVNNNNYYITPANGAGLNRIGYIAGTSYNTLTDWQATGKDGSSISVDPVYNDLAKGDLTPTKIPTENKGANVGITTDAYNVIRSTSTPDIGAIEYTICRTLTTPVLTVDEASVNTIKLSWTAVPGTSGYRVSRDGINWSIPSSGALGTTHTIVALNPSDSVDFIVKALGARVDCPDYLSQWVHPKAQNDKVFIPNMFSPNNNGVDDNFMVYSTVMKTIHLMVFNQWGLKVFETNDPKGMWDGNYKGKPQAVGVYIYVVTGTLFDGTKVNQKGTFNLIR